MSITKVKNVVIPACCFLILLHVVPPMLTAADTVVNYMGLALVIISFYILIAMGIKFYNLIKN